MTWCGIIRSQNIMHMHEVYMREQLIKAITAHATGEILIKIINIAMLARLEDV